MQKTATIAAVVLATVATAATAEAKDPYELVSDLVGKKVVSSKIFGDKYHKPSKSTERVEILHRGYDETVVVDRDGVRNIQATYAGSDFAWEGSNGYIYQISDYPSGNQHAPVWGTILDQDKKIGVFELTSVKSRSPKVAGRWAGEMAFPGGSSVGISFQVASIPQPIGDTCLSYDTRVNFFGLGYENTSMVTCKGDEGRYGAGFFYFDERSSARYFVNIQLENTDDGGWLQGSVFMLPLNGGNSAEGKIVTSRPPVLQF